MTIRMVEPSFGGIMVFIKSDTRGWEEPDAGPDAGPASSGEAWKWLGSWVDFPIDNQWASYEISIDSPEVNLQKVQAVGAAFVAGDWIEETQNLYFAVDSVTVY